MTDEDPYANVHQFPTAAYPVVGDGQVPEPDPAPVDPEAPYGRRADGKPYTMPEEERRSIAERLRDAKARKAGAQPPPRRSTRSRASSPPKRGSGGPASSGTPPRPSVTAPIGKDYRPGLSAFAAIPVTILGMLGRNNRAFQYDAVAVTLHVPAIVQAAQEWSEQDARVAALLDKVTAITPAGAFLAALVPLAMQIGHNHGMLPAVPELGVIPTDQLIEELERRHAA